MHTMTAAQTGAKNEDPEGKKEEENDRDKASKQYDNVSSSPQCKRTV